MGVKDEVCRQNVTRAGVRETRFSDHRSAMGVSCRMGARIKAES